VDARQFVGLECFVGGRENFVLSALINFEPIYKDLRTGEIRRNLGVLYTAHAASSLIEW